MSGVEMNEIKIPTLVLNETIARENMKKMAAKAVAQNIRFRPHFKTHQSIRIGEWMREVGVNYITVSSVSMAQQFAQHGWKDILIAFPVNLRESAEIDKLAAEIRLSILIESIESAQHLNKRLKNKVDAWIKIDTGMHRAGIWWEKINEIIKVAQAVNSVSYTHLTLPTKRIV